MLPCPTCMCDTYGRNSLFRVFWGFGQQNGRLVNVFKVFRGVLGSPGACPQNRFGGASSQTSVGTPPPNDGPELIVSRGAEGYAGRELTLPHRTPTRVIGDAVGFRDRNITDS